MDECNNKPSPCHQVCKNTLGSYECSCFDNYKLLPDNEHCTGNYLSYVLSLIYEMPHSDIRISQPFGAMGIKLGSYDLHNITLWDPLMLHLKPHQERKQTISSSVT